MQQIIIIEDEQSIADTVIHAVKREGYAATWRMQGRVGLEEIKKGAYALAILDVGLPDISGFELCKEVRKFSSIPIMFLTARDDEIDTIVGLEIGGDDYMTKPFSPRELGARVKSILRRTASSAGQHAPAQHETGAKATNSDEKSCGGETQSLKQNEQPTSVECDEKGNAPATSSGTTPSLVVDEEKFQATFQNKRLELTRYEFKLLALLYKYPGRVFSRDALMQTVWGDDSPSLDRTVDTHVKSLRAKFRDIDRSYDPIVTLRGVGYALREDL